MISIDQLISASRIGLALRVPSDESQVWIRGVAIIQTIDEIAQLRRGDLVLADLNELTADDGVVNALTQHGAAALGCAPLTSRGMPQRLVSSCLRRRLPLLEIPPGVGCRAVASAARDLLHGSQPADLPRLLRREHSLARSLTAGCGVATMLGILGQECRLRLWLLAEGVALTPHPPHPQDAEIRAVLSASERQPGAFEVSICDRRAWVYPLRTSGKRAAYCVCELPDGELAPELTLVVEQNMVFVEAAIAMRDAMRAARRLSEAEFIHRIEAGQAASEEIDAWCRALGFQTRGHLTCVLVRGPGIAGPVGEVVADALRDLGDTLGVFHLVVTVESEVRAFLIKQDAGAVDIDADLARIRWVLDARFGSLDTSWGVSSVLAEHVSDFTRVLLDARQVCILNSLREGTARSSEAHGRSLGAMLLAKDGGAMAALNDALLTPLVDYDNSHGTDLVRTLDVFLSTCGQWNTSASRLGIHVNTLRYRLRRIEKVTGRELASMSDRVDLYLAIRARGCRESNSVVETKPGGVR